MRHTDRFKAGQSTTTATSCTTCSSTAGRSPWRRLPGETLLVWHGETEIHPPPGLRRIPRTRFCVWPFGSDDYADDLRDDRRLLRPDAIIEVEDPEGAAPLTYLFAFQPPAPRRQELRSSAAMTAS